MGAVIGGAQPGGGRRRTRRQASRWRPSGRQARHDTGMVTAEAAVVLPIIAAFALLLVWLLSVGIAQVRVVDAARDAARALARGDDSSMALAAARRTAPAGSQIMVGRAGGFVTVTVSLHATAPSWLLVPLPSITVGSHSTVEMEGDRDGG
ncbi:MAG: TadE family type IV pilus minor pilin [Nocardioidaceae bacterium]